MRGRWIKPELWSSTSLAECSLEATLLFVGLCNYVDDEGRNLSDPSLIRSTLFPLRPAVTDAMVVEWLEELRRVDSIRFGRARERANGATRRARKAADVLEIVAWDVHYRSDHPRPSRWDAIAPRRSSRSKARRGLEEDSTKARGARAPKGRVVHSREVVAESRALEESVAGVSPNGAGDSPDPEAEPLVETVLRERGEPDLFGEGETELPLVLEPTDEPSSEPRPSPASWRTRPNPWADLPPIDEAEL